MDSHKVVRPRPAVLRPTVPRLALLACLAACGCATTPYQYGRFHPESPDGVALQPIEVEYGKPHKTLDRIGSIIGLPAKILTFNRKTDNHRISPETVEKLQTYLEDNDITDVYVAVNDYAPKDQWRRLRENDRMAPFWRYSAGTLAWVGYTVFPNRIFGGDRYNPYTNTLNLSSDVPALVLAEAAYAKDIHSRRHPGTYALLVNDMPVLSIFRQARAASDVLGYARAKDDWKTEEQGYKVLYPKIGAAAAGTGGPFVPGFGWLLHLGGAAVGHVTGRTVARVQKSALPKPPPGTAPDGNSPLEEGLTPSQIADREESAPPAPSPPSPRQRRGDVIPANHEELSQESSAGEVRSSE